MICLKNMLCPCRAGASFLDICCLLLQKNAVLSLIPRIAGTAGKDWAVRDESNTQMIHGAAICNSLFHIITNIYIAMIKIVSYTLW